LVSSIPIDWFAARIKILTETNCSHQYLSIDPCSHQNLSIDPARIKILTEMYDARIKIVTEIYWARIQIFTEMYCTRQYLSIDPKKLVSIPID